ncbi:MAG: TMEM175 family protein [Chloroflexota bacterium]
MPERSMGFERAVFFSDAVFAIAITLLVIDLRLPEAAEAAGETPIATLLGEMVPQFLAFAISFAVIGMFWMAHWRRYGLVARVDERLLWLNLLLLAFVVLMPFPTAVIAAHGGDPGAVMLYVAVVAAAGAASTLAWAYAWRAGLLVPGLTRRYVRMSALRGLTVAIVMVATLPLLAFGPYLVEWSWLLIIPAQIAVNRRLARVRAEDGIPAPA